MREKVWGDGELSLLSSLGSNLEGPTERMVRKTFVPRPESCDLATMPGRRWKSQLHGLAAASLPKEE